MGVLLMTLAACTDFDEELEDFCQRNPGRCGIQDGEESVTFQFVQTPPLTSYVEGGWQLTFFARTQAPNRAAVQFAWTASTGTLGSQENALDSSQIQWTAPACLPSGPLASFTVTAMDPHGTTLTERFNAVGIPDCPTWSSTGPMTTGRRNHTATLLYSGEVLVTGAHAEYGTGGQAATTEVYDPITGTWQRTSTMTFGRGHHTATLLPSGQVLVTGGISESGQVLASAELLEQDSIQGVSWKSTGSMPAARYGHSATRLLSGQVLVAGGSISSGDPGTAVLYAPETGTWVSTGSMASSRQGHTATLLHSGKVLVTGGETSDGTVLASAELYDPATGKWTPTGLMTGKRRDHTATLLPSGLVLITGGDVSALASAELYAPSTGTWTSTGNMLTGRHDHSATLLPSGKVMVVGGLGSWNTLISYAELYDPASKTWAPNGNLASARSGHTATLLSSGTVLITGGLGESRLPGPGLSTSEICNPDV
ncbi:Kelch repeat-containing protein [Corallococcus exiguus]|uniref:Kelch repeat-containing protein n=1 Tax=Corallococcus exiguus TaxID=83462 RepID=UPI001A8C5756|nr:kelch repeat-containing protein [Corallococcus exiguus]